MAETTKPTPSQPAADPSKILKTGIDQAKKEREQRLPEWQLSVDYRRGKPFDTDSDQDRVYVNVDAPMTRRKATELASQLPEARLTTEDPRVKPVLGQFAQRLNKEARKAGTGVAMWECTNDAINASGFGWVMIGFEARTEPVDVVAADRLTLSPEQLEAVNAFESGELPPDQGKELLDLYGVQTTPQERVVSSRFYVRRGSPADYLWPQDYERSDFNQSPWQGHSGRMSWPEGKIAFKLKDEDKEAVCGDQLRENLRNSNEHAEDDDNRLVVEYDEAFYWRAYYDPEEKHFDCIYRIVFVHGKEKPVVHEQWEGQKYLDQIGYVGAIKLPIQVLTLDYISDDPIPPSDSALARPQTNELMRSRTQMILQRERATPQRWHDVNRVDPLVAVNLMKGYYQGSIPVKGNGNGIIGEVARASYPPENYEFDRTIKGDIQEQWNQGDNTLGLMSRGRRTAAESNNAQGNFNKQMGFQRARVGAFLVNIFEVLAGLLTLHGQGLPLPAPDEQNPMDVAEMSGAITYAILPDSTMLLDSDQQANELLDLLDMVGKSPYVNPKPIIEEIIRLKSAIDPALVMVDPQPKEEKPAISYRFGGVQDLHDPLVLATLVSAGLAPGPDHMKEAIEILKVAQAAIAAGLILPPPSAENDPSSDNPPDKKPGGSIPDDANPEWTSMPKITKRSSPGA